MVLMRVVVLFRLWDGSRGPVRIGWRNCGGVVSAAEGFELEADDLVEAEQEVHAVDGGAGGAFYGGIHESLYGECGVLYMKMQ